MLFRSPVAIGYFDVTRVLVAWCELRQDFRSFRTDRIGRAEFLGERYPERVSMLRTRWRKAVAERKAQAGYARPDIDDCPSRRGKVPAAAS